MKFVYPASFSRTGPDEIVVSFRDFPECLTSGTNLREAISAAIDALEEAIAGRIDDSEEIPAPSRLAVREKAIPVPPAYGRKGCACHRAA